VPVEAIAFYHELLRTHSLAAESEHVLQDELRRQNLLTAQGRPLCGVLRPRFLSPVSSAMVTRKTRLLSDAVRTVHRAALESEAIRAAFHLSEWEEAFLQVPSGYSSLCPISRFDGFLSPTGGLKFCELNAQSPAGAAYSDCLASIFTKLPVMHEFEKRYPCPRTSTVSGVLAALLRAYHEWSGSTSEKPRIAIVDWEDVPTRQEFYTLREKFEKAGYPTQVVAPERLDFAHGKLHAAGVPVSLVYRRVMLGELVERQGLDHPLIRAARVGAACVVNPIHGRLLGKKACFAMLSDEQYCGLFTAEQERAIHETIPWTRFLRESRTNYAGEEIDLISFVIQNPTRFVLKPNDSFGGEQVMLGWTIPANEWEATVTSALGKSFVVQERIPLPSERYPTWADGELRFVEFQQDTCPFVGEDTTFGCLTRLSAHDKINVAQGGSLVPTFELN
jgi:rRNA maturation protein Nop10